MKLLLLTFLTVFGIYNLQAQQHNLNPESCCKLLHNYKGTECTRCPACDKIIDDERKAKEAENQKNADAIIAKAKAEKADLQKAHDTKLVGDAKKAESGKVYINGNGNAVSTSNAVLKATEPATDKTIMKGAGVRCSGDASTAEWAFAKIFKNEKGEEILQNNDWKSTFSILQRSVTTGCIANMGIVTLGPSYCTSYSNLEHEAVVNSKGEYVWKDDNAKSINHINDGWLLIDCKAPNKDYLYNLFSKAKIELNDISGSEGAAINKFYPITSSAIKNRRDSRTEYAKEFLINMFPAQINEDLLIANSFMLLHTDQLANRFEPTEPKYVQVAYNECNTVLLYCMSKKGELSIIKLK